MTAGCFGSRIILNVKKIVWHWILKQQYLYSNTGSLTYTRTGNNRSNNNIDKKIDRGKHTPASAHDYYGFFIFFFFLNNRLPDGCRCRGLLP